MEHEQIARRFGGSGGSELRLVQGDITAQQVDAIVNAANAELAGGGGVDGAIHRVGGDEIGAACREIGGCPTGQAVSTTAGYLPARWVIHAVGPIYHDGRSGEAELLASAYRAALTRAIELRAGSVAFPSLSTGAYGYPIEQASRIALTTVAAELDQRPNLALAVRFVLFDQAAFDAFASAMQEI